MQIVVGFDGSDQARDALALAEVLRGPDGEEPIVESIDAGDAADALAEIARDVDADVIVIGSTHRGKLGRVLPGSVGERLLGSAPCAVAIAPKGYAQHRHPPISLVGVGYDASGEASVARREAEALARRFNAQLRLIGVAPGIENLPGGRITNTNPAYVRSLRERVADGLEAALAACDSDTDTEAVFQEGDPAAALAGQGVELDLLVLGSRGHGPLRTVVLGGVAWDTVRTAPCPVLVVPRGARVENAAAAS